jgi:hypothetical protein
MSLRDVLQLLELQGIAPGTPEFEFKVLESKVNTCRERLGMPSCEDCSQFENCDLAKDYRIQVLYGPQE